MVTRAKHIKPLYLLGSHNVTAPTCNGYEWNDWLNAKDEGEIRDYLRLFDADQFQARASPRPPSARKSETAE